VKRRLALVAVLAALDFGPARAAEIRAFDVPELRPAELGPLPLLQPVLSAPLGPAAAAFTLPPGSPAMLLPELPPAAAPLPAPARSAQVGAAAALPRLQASALAGGAATADGVSDGAERALASRAFDEAREGPEEADAIAPAAAPTLPSYLDAPDPEHAAWIASVVAEASRSKTGGAVLARVRRMAEKRGRPVIVLVAPIGNAGEYAFDHEIVTIDSSFMAGPPLEAAPVFVHELAHVLQLAHKLPADAFEMEVEAYLAQFRVADELGYKPKRGTFHWSAYRRFKNDPDRFMAWLLKEYDGNLAVTGGGSVEDYTAALELRRAVSTSKLDRLEKRADSKRRVIARMEKTGQPAKLIEQYRLDELAPLEEKLRVARRDLGWLERDLSLLRTPESRDRYVRYAGRVIKKLRAYHARLAENG